MSNAFIVAGMCWGDEGKGSCVDYLCHRYKPDVVIRYNGGCQAAHNVIAEDGLHHTFSQFGSGTLAGVRTHLSRFMLVEPMALLKEATVLKDKGFDSLHRLSIDPECVIVTPFHWLANQLREIARGASLHGTTGRGVGEARGDELGGLALRVSDLYKRGEALDILTAISHRKAEELGAVITNVTDLSKGYDEIWRLYDRLCSVNVLDLYERYWEFVRLLTVAKTYNVVEAGDTVVFEGAQGVLLDEVIGFAPHNTWTDTTFRNAETFCRECQIEDVQKIGVIRSYFTRHGAGPFPTETGTKDDLHNGFKKFVGPFRVGHFDNVLFQYAVKHSRPDVVVVTHMDQAGSLACLGYQNFSMDSVAAGSKEMTQGLFQAIPEVSTVGSIPALIEAAGIPVVYESFGPKASDKRESHLENVGVKKYLTRTLSCVTV